MCLLKHLLLFYPKKLIRTYKMLFLSKNYCNLVQLLGAIMASMPNFYYIAYDMIYIYIYIFNFFVFFVLGIQNFCNEPFLKTKDKKNVRVFPIIIIIIIITTLHMKLIVTRGCARFGRLGFFSNLLPNR